MSPADPITVGVDLAAPGGDMTAAVIVALDRLTGQMRVVSQVFNDFQRTTIKLRLREVLALPQFRPQPNRARTSRRRRLVINAKLCHGQQLRLLTVPAWAYFGKGPRP